MGKKKINNQFKDTFKTEVQNDWVLLKESISTLNKIIGCKISIYNRSDKNKYRKYT